MPYGTVNADVIQTSTSGGILGAGNASIMKNRIINGAMVISQRSGTSSVSPTDGQYSVDRWQCRTDLTGKYTFQQNAGAVTPPVGFPNYLGITSSTAYTVPAGGYYFLEQGIEGFNVADLGFGTANAKPVTISFWVQSSLTGTFGGSLQNFAGTRSYPFSYTISSANTWEQKTITVAGDTSGTWVGATNAGAMYLNFGLGLGSNWMGTAGTWASANYFSATGATSVVGTSGATFYITGVQLEVGSSATGYEYVNYQTSLANCQRYYEKSYAQGTVPGTATGTGATGNFMIASSFWVCPVKFSVNKRANPTMTYYSPKTGTAGYVRSGTGAGTDIAVIDGEVAGESNAYAYIGTGSTIAGIAAFHWTSSIEL